MTLNDYFDEIYLINLKNDTEKLKETKRVFDALSSTFKRFEAVQYKNSSSITERVIGCYLSHIGCLKDALENNKKNVLICEDDICVKKTLMQDIDTIMTAVKDVDCDVLYFYNVNNPSKILVNRPQVAGTHFYNVRNIKKVLELYENGFDLSNVKPIDKVLMWKPVNVYVTGKPYVNQIASFSSILRRTRQVMGCYVDKTDEYI